MLFLICKWRNCNSERLDVFAKLHSHRTRWDLSQDLSIATDTAKSLQSCPTLCDTVDSSPQGSPIPGILEARTLAWVAISFSNAWKWKVKVKSLSCVWLFATPWTAAYQAPPSMGFSRQEYWSRLPCPPPGDLLNPEIEPRSPTEEGIHRAWTPS